MAWQQSRDVLLEVHEEIQSTMTAKAGFPCGSESRMEASSHHFEHRVSFLIHAFHNNHSVEVCKILLISKDDLLFSYTFLALGNMVL